MNDNEDVRETKKQQKDEWMHRNIYIFNLLILFGVNP